MAKAFAAVLGAVLGISTPIFAQYEPVGPSRPAPPLRSTVNRHFGFYIRPDLGFGYMSASESVGGTTVTVSGASGLGGVAIGGAVSENHILAVHIVDSVASNPSVSASSGNAGPSSYSQLLMWGIGPEYTYYFMPENIYVSGTLALTRISVNNGNRTASTDAGLGARLGVGKEWWVSDHWGLGIAGHFSLSTNQDPAQNGMSFTMNTWALGAVFSATYN